VNVSEREEFPGNEKEREKLFLVRGPARRSIRR
jgi:hypothetical protein